MAIEAKQILELLDFQGNPEEATPELIQEHIGKTFIGREVAHTDEELVNKITGKRMGSFNTVQTRTFKELGVEFAPEEVKGKKEEEIFQLGIQKINEQINSLKESAKQGSDAKAIKLQKELEDLQKKNNDTTGLLENAQKTIEQKDAEYNSKIKSFTLNSKLAEVKKALPISKDANPYQVKGWEADIQENYEFDLDGEELIVKDRKTGERVKTANGTGHKFETVENILLLTGDKAGIIAKNTGNGSTAKSTSQTSTQTGLGPGNGQSSAFSPAPNKAAMENLEKLKAAQG